MLKCLPFLILTWLLSACTRYEYDIVHPPDLATHISKQEVSVPREPLLYRMQVVDNHLVMLIDNPTDDPYQLLGEQSTVVDPGGQSHPLRPMAIAPHSFGKLIIPPVSPRYYYPYNSGFGVGVGTVIVHDHRHHFVDDPDYFVDEEPRYLAVVDDNLLYWDWKGEGQIRMTLMFQRRDEKPFAHDWVISRSKAR
jgi:hypothetical protein